LKSVDFTYLVAGLLSLLIGFVGAILFVLLRWQSYKRLLTITVLITLIADFALLLDWSRTDEMTADFLLIDLAFFAIYALIGCSITALVVLGSRRLYRWLHKILAD